MVSRRLDFVAVDYELAAGGYAVVYGAAFNVDEFVDVAGGVCDAFDIYGDVFSQAAQFGQCAEAEGDWVLFVVVDFRCVVESAAYVRVQGIVAGVDGETVAELVRRFVKELLDGLDQIIIVAAVTSSVLERGAYLLNTEGCFRVGAGDVHAFDIAQVVGVEFDSDAVQYLCDIVDDCHD